MTETWSEVTIDRLAKQLREPGWVTELRRTALARHRELPWPHPSDDVWRRTDVSLLDPSQGFVPAEPKLLQAVPLDHPQVARSLKPLDGEQLAARLNGSWLSPPALTGVNVQELSDAAKSSPAVVRRLLESNGLTDAEEKFASLNAAFHHDDLFIQVPGGVRVEQPVRLLHLLSVAPKQAVFPMTIITVGSGSSLTLIDEYISIPAGSSEPHLVNSRIELILESDATVHYVRLQRWAPTAREFLLQRATLSGGAHLTMANINLGAALSKAHIATRFTGEHAESRLYGFVFGHHTQHIDQHTLQDHQAAHTFSDLQVKAALQDQSRMVYTGLIRIAKRAQHTNAYQANHNLMLSRDAQAETIPMLEILADDVQCKHGASISPIDEEQTFYLMSRGVPREAAERLVVMGFVEPIVQQIPFAPLQEQLRQEIEGSLH
ncbi:MAG TPA: Fe-S cluster assembly protein SufD [Candidatus Omnitrophica bacterium]|nr:MAG: Fe-S cluster assembly protein SufD [Omnitrophica WOR_2 bacterium GWA2_63_20]OGX35882.1 MAG: Fe-S cluster assembly protein SufD [Omnitrophica WOR_2 bacterium RIFCSPHIGHO2_02_FULL_63_39]OGX44490.1 MAG: Fe-S cluster assembly protein SufD [Omnitrophica WOR_2 bacterium RIFCSPLOWO2_02_FULL_63_16]OGX50096.1 MAG: Fe-S cluster assembly protein SufD [Omnitrophica WOR_2 bacterium RIFCSPLOWO2_12_FULL_63_16]HBH97471.1 Fe-S cluster assembly protein SufD [Candidatus Omnitrophota bacterium]